MRLKPALRVALPMRQVILPILVAFALLASAAPATAKPVRVSEDKDKIVLENDHVKVWFQGKKPMLKLFAAGNDSAAFEYKFTQVVEYRDLDADGLPGETEVVSRLLLEKASAFEVNTTEVDDGVVLNLSLTAPVKLTGNPVLENVTVPDRDATVRIVFTLREADATLDVDGADVPVAATSVKYDLVVETWPFVDAAANRLALDTRVTGHVEADPVGALGAATVDANGTLGALTWVTTAEGKTASGQDVDVPVKTAIKPDAADANVTRVVFTYDAANLASLVHDPTVGVASAEDADEATDATSKVSDAVKDVPGVGAIALVVGVAAAAIVARRGRA